MCVEGVECPERRRGQDLNVTLMLAFAIHMEVFASRYVSDCFGVRLSVDTGRIKDSTSHGTVGL